VLALRLHFVPRCSNAPVDATVPAGAEYDLLNVCVATFASTILTFFIGALLSDYQLARTEARRGEQLEALLVADLDVVSEGLDGGHAVGLRLL
jgi:hypothetical protein